MVVAAGGDEGGVLAVALHQLEAEHAAVEVEGAVDVGDLEVDVADVDAGIDRLDSLVIESLALVERLVDEPVGVGVLGSRRTWRIDQQSKPAQRRFHLGVQLLHRRVLDLVSAFDC